MRALEGKKVQTSHGLAETLAQLSERDGGVPQRRSCGSVAIWCRTSFSTTGRLVVAHAGLIEKYHGRASGRVRAFSLFGDTTGETDEYGLPVRLPWAEDYRGEATVLYGHVPDPRGRVDQRHDVPRHRLRVRRKAQRPPLPGKRSRRRAGREVWYEPVAPLGATERSRGSETRDPGAAEHRRCPRQAGRRDSRFRARSASEKTRPLAHSRS